MPDTKYYSRVGRVECLNDTFKNLILIMPNEQLSKAQERRQTNPRDFDAIRNIVLYEQLIDDIKNIPDCNFDQLIKEGKVYR